MPLGGQAKSVQRPAVTPRPRCRAASPLPTASRASPRPRGLLGLRLLLGEHPHRGAVEVPAIVTAFRSLETSNFRIAETTSGLSSAAIRIAARIPRSASSGARARRRRRCSPRRRAGASPPSPSSGRRTSRRGSSRRGRSGPASPLPLEIVVRALRLGKLRPVDEEPARGARVDPLSRAEPGAAAEAGRPRRPARRAPSRRPPPTPPRGDGRSTKATAPSPWCSGCSLSFRRK